MTGNVVEARVEAIGGGVTVTDPPLLQIPLHEARAYLDEIGAALAAGTPVRIVDSDDSNLLPDRLPPDVASMIESARLSHESRARAAGALKDEGDKEK